MRKKQLDKSFHVWNCWLNVKKKNLFQQIINNIFCVLHIRWKTIETHKSMGTRRIYCVFGSDEVQPHQISTCANAEQIAEWLWEILCRQRHAYAKWYTCARELHTICSAADVQHHQRNKWRIAICMRYIQKKTLMQNNE